MDDIDELCRRAPEHAEALRELHANYFAGLNLLPPIAAGDPADFDTEDRYELRGELASGGMGSILAVWDRRLRRLLAMKVVRQAKDGIPLDRETWERRQSRLLNEAQVLGQLVHPGIVPVHDTGHNAAGDLYFTMQLIKGRDLGEIIDETRSGDGGWSTTRLVGVVLRVCEAVAYAHSKGVLHRDLKPQNVMVGPFGEIYVLDWGLAKTRDANRGAPFALDAENADVAPARPVSSDDGQSLVHTDRSSAASSDSGLLTMVGDVVGTPNYMSPEQAEGRIDLVDERSDVYSVGAMLYHVLSRKRPYDDQETRVLAAVIEGPPLPLGKVAPGTPDELVAICERAMQRGQGHRYASMSELADDLRAYLEGHVVRAHRTGAFVELRKWVARNRGAAAAVLIFVLCLLAIVLILNQSTRSLAKANEETKERAVALQQRIYFNTVQLANVALERGDTDALDSLLDKCPPRLRDWEWRYLSCAADTSDVTLRGHVGRIRVMQVSRDGRTLAACGDDHVTLWDVEKRTLVGRFELVGSVESCDAEFGPLGKRLLVARRDGMVRVYSLPSGRVQRAVRCSENAIWTVSLSPDGRQLLTGSDDGVIQLRDSESLELVATLQTGLRAISSVIWAPDGKTAFAGCRDVEVTGERRSKVRIYDVQTRTLKSELAGHDSWVGSVSLDPSGQRLASAGWNGRILIWDLASARLLHEVNAGTRLEHCLWLPNGDLAVPNGPVLELRSGTGFHVSQRLVGHRNWCGWFLLDPTGRWLITSGLDRSGEDVVKLWDWTRRDRVVDVEVGPTRLFSVALRPGSREVAIGTFDARQQVEVWDLVHRRRLRRLPIQAGRVRLDYTPDGTQLLESRCDGSIALRNGDTGELLVQKQLPGAGFGRAAFHPIRSLVATAGSDAKVRLWDLRDLSVLWTREAGNPPAKWPEGAWGPSFSPDGQRLAVGAADGKLRVLETSTGATLRELHTDATRYDDPDFSPDGRYIVAIARQPERSLALWDLADGKVRWEVPSNREAMAPVFSASGARIFTVSVDASLVVWDAATGTRIVTFAGPIRGTPSALALSRDRDTFVAGLDPSLLRVWTAKRR